MESQKMLILVLYTTLLCFLPTFSKSDTTSTTPNHLILFCSGYMPPEYAVHGSFSTKSDVFGYGVIVLEIISGRKNRGFHDPHNHLLNLLGHAWRLWIEERSLEFIDDLLDDTTNTSSEILRCINIGLLCVQQNPEDRPNMSSVVLMLNGGKLVSKPNQPGFYTGKANTTETGSSSKQEEVCSINEISISFMQAR
ncbi:hypothetical protein VNO78_12717 [Psophocarpus tetragonolobus]|uniref:Uncharacterized protein n=1 Tax=Psophocarpus tetragonolobus TaxID=3891 RepID=A0AAN9SPD0_PSOTE